MSVYIPGLSMPRKTGIVSIVLSGDGSALLCEDGAYSEIKVIPVPEHGRLIDADEVDDILADQSEDEYNRTHAPRSWERALSVMRDYLKDAPTIIPAEPPKEETK